MIFPPHETWDIDSPRTYLISAPIVPYYYTQMIGDAKVPPTLLAASSFNGFAVIGASSWCWTDFSGVQWFQDANPYIPLGGGAQYFQATNNLWDPLEPSFLTIGDLILPSLYKVTVQFEISWSTLDSKLTCLRYSIILTSFDQSPTREISRNRHPLASCPSYVSHQHCFRDVRRSKYCASR